MAYNPAIEEYLDGSGIYKLSPDFIGVNTLEELQALDTFSYLDGQDRLDAETALLAQVLNFNGTDDISEMSVNHTNGVQLIRVGTGTATTSTAGGGIANGVFTPTPDLSFWKTHAIVATASKLKVSTNIVAGNCSGLNIFCMLIQAYKNGANSSTSGTRSTISFGATSSVGAGTHGVVSGGPTYAGNVGDDGTFYAEILTTPIGTNCEIGSGNPNDQYYYYILMMEVDSAAATKNYKFKFEVDY